MKIEELFVDREKRKKERSKKGKLSQGTKEKKRTQN
jgi:hypothetical protein